MQAGRLGAVAQGKATANLQLPQVSQPEAAPVHAAALMLVGSLYESRESQSDRPIIENRLFTRLLDPYRAVEA